MENLRGMAEFAESDPEAVDALQSQLERLENTIRTEGFSSSVLAAIAGLSSILSSLGQTDMCHLGRGAPAPRWSAIIEGKEYSTCGHAPPHIQLKLR